MLREQIIRKRLLEKEMRNCLNAKFHYDSYLKILTVGQSLHEFDVFQSNKIIGGITTSPWFNSTGSNNTGGQDRVAAELLWLSLWQGQERRVMILSDETMADRICKKYQGCEFKHLIEIIYYDKDKKTLTEKGKCNCSE